MPEIKTAEANGKVKLAKKVLKPNPMVFTQLNFARMSIGVLPGKRPEG